MVKAILITLLSFLFIFSEIFPQSHLSFDHITVEDGLSQNSVYCIFQDRKGFMWFGTQNGLNRYDGYNIKIFKNIPGDSTSLNDNFVFSIYEDLSGTLYIETQSGAFHRYYPRSESFQKVQKDSIDLRKAKVSSVLAQLMEDTGIKWTGGLGQGTGLQRIDTKTGETTIYNHNPSDPSSISDDKVYSIYRDRSGNLWVGTHNGLDRLDESIGKFIQYRNDQNDPFSIADNWVWPIFEDSRGKLWVGTNKGGLCLFDQTSGRFYNYKNDPYDPSSLSANFVFSIFEDRGGIIWVGTDKGGVNYFYPSSQAFVHYKNESGNKNSLSDNMVISMLVDRDGNYWIGTRNGGLNKLNNNNIEFSHFQYNSSNLNSISSNSIQCLLQDRAGNIWIGTFSNGLDALDLKSGTFKHYSHNPSDSYSISDDGVYSMVEDKIGNIWIGTRNGGLNKWDKSTGKFQRFQSKENDPSTISSNATWSLAFDDKDNLWIGTFGGGLNVLNLRTQSIKYYQHNSQDLNSISDNSIIRIFKDSKGNMWVGSTKGLSKYLEDRDNFKNYDEEDGLANNFVFGILEDDKGYLWISTNNGLSKFNPVNETFKNYYQADGLQGNEFNQNAFAKDNKTGRLLFGGNNGFNVFHPDSIVGNNYLPPIVITNYLRYNTDDEEGKPILEKGISVRDSILLTYKDNIATLEFSALSYYNSFDNQYRYKLEGFNENWIQLSTNHSVTFTNLSPGDYNLRVIGSNSDGVWNETGASLFIEVTPPWWRTNIAYSVYFIAFIGALLGIRRFETNRREQKAKMRENELRLKATEAEKRAIEIENERKTKELEEARQLQLSMLPKELPKLPNLEIAAFMRTATEVGGDYYDFIEQENGILNVGFGDATGHGLQAGTMVTLMKGFFTSDAAKLSLQEFMNHCTSMIKEIKLGRILMSFSLLRIYDSKLSITSAGMPPILYYDSDQGIIDEIAIQGMPLGAMRKFSYNVVEKEVKSGDVILLLTDGLPEQMNENEEMFGYPRVKERFNDFVNLNPEKIIENLIQAGDLWMGKKIQDDDISFVVIKVK